VTTTRAVRRRVARALLSENPFSFIAKRGLYLFHVVSISRFVSSLLKTYANSEPRDGARLLRAKKRPA
jgi:hypothetical protein